jgi:hypothetical protein
VYPLAVKIPLNRVLSHSRVTHELAHTEALGSKYVTGISGTSVLGFARFVSYRTRGFNHTDVFSFLRLPLNLFAYKTEWF